MSRRTAFPVLTSPLFNLRPSPAVSISSVCNPQLGRRWCLACHHLLAHFLPLPLPPVAPVPVPTPALLASLLLHFKDDSLWFQGYFTRMPHFLWPWPPLDTTSSPSAPLPMVVWSSKEVCWPCVVRAQPVWSPALSPRAPFITTEYAVRLSRLLFPRVLGKGNSRFSEHVL